MKFLTGMFLLVVWTSSSFAKFEIVDVVRCDGYLGPIRPSWDAYPTDEVFFRYFFKGVSTDNTGKTDLEVVLTLHKDPKEKPLFTTSGSLKAALPLGGGTIPSFNFFTVAQNAIPGDYTITVTARDKIANETATFKKTFAIKEPTLNILAPRFYRDAEGKIPASAGGYVGENLHFRMRIAGFDRSMNRFSLNMRVEFLDESDRPVDSKPLTVSVEEKDPEKVSKAVAVPLNGSFLLNRVGNYRLKITAEDTLSKKTTQLIIPVKVTQP